MPPSLTNIDRKELREIFYSGRKYIFRQKKDNISSIFKHANNIFLTGHIPIAAIFVQTFDNILIFKNFMFQEFFGNGRCLAG